VQLIYLRREQVSRVLYFLENVFSQVRNVFVNAGSCASLSEPETWRSGAFICLMKEGKKKGELKKEESVVKRKMERILKRKNK
jgi:hypothetical protein